MVQNTYEYAYEKQENNGTCIEFNNASCIMEMIAGNKEKAAATAQRGEHSEQHCQPALAINQHRESKTRVKKHFVNECPTLTECSDALIFLVDANKEQKEMTLELV